jgi:hypothetical protein
VRVVLACQTWVPNNIKVHGNCKLIQKRRDVRKESNSVAAQIPSGRRHADPDSGPDPEGDATAGARANGECVPCKGADQGVLRSKSKITDSRQRSVREK